MSVEPHEVATRQAMLSSDPLEGLEGDGLGYRDPMACTTVSITYRQSDYWARTGLPQPPVHAVRGSGSQRLCSFKDILALKIVKRLLDTGVSLQQVHTIVAQLRGRGVDDLASIAPMSDGASVYECTSTDEAIDLLQGGQGVFGIAVGCVWREVEGIPADLPIERLGGEPVDELAERHRRECSASQVFVLFPLSAAPASSRPLTRRVFLPLPPSESSRLLNLRAPQPLALLLFSAVPRVLLYELKSASGLLTPLLGGSSIYSPLRNRSSFTDVHCPHAFTHSLRQYSHSYPSSA